MCANRVSIIRTTIFILGFILVFSCQVSASQTLHPSLGYWYSFGKADWKIGGELGNAGGGGTFESVLEFQELDAPLLLFSLEWDLLESFSVDFSYGWSHIGDGKLIDSDFTDVPSLGVNQALFSESRSRSTGTTELLHFNLYYKVWKSGKGTLLDLFLGYQQYKDRLRITKGFQTVTGTYTGNIPTGGKPEVPPAKISGLRSFYNFRWRAPRVGFRGKYQLLDRLFAEGNFGFFPWIDYYGKAYWNLRNDLKQTPPNFTHNAHGGFGYDIKISLFYLPTENLSFQLGYKFFRMKIEGGKDVTWLRDGKREISNLKEVRVFRHGPVATVTYSF